MGHFSKCSVFRWLISIVWPGAGGEREEYVCDCVQERYVGWQSVAKYGPPLDLRHSNPAIVFSSSHVTSSSSHDPSTTMWIIAIFFWTCFMIKFWYFVIQNLDKACYINFLIGTLVQVWVAWTHYLLISSKHSQDSGRKRLQIVKWLHKISLNYADDKQVFVQDSNEIASRFHSWYWATITTPAH